MNEPSIILQLQITNIYSISYVNDNRETQIIKNKAMNQNNHIVMHLAQVIPVVIQSTLDISNSLISNNRLSRSKNLVPILTQRFTNKQQNIVEKRRNCSLGAISPLFHNIFNISPTWESNLRFILLKVVVCLIVFLSSANLICRSTDISKCFIESLGFRDNESRLYIFLVANDNRFFL